MTAPNWFGYTESPEKVRARWEAWQRRAAEYEEYIANLVHSAYGEALEDDPQRDAETQARDVEKFGWYDVPEIKDGVSSPAWFEAQPEVEF